MELTIGFPKNKKLLKVDRKATSSLLAGWEVLQSEDYLRRSCGPCPAAHFRAGNPAPNPPPSAVRLCSSERFARLAALASTLAAAQRAAGTSTRRRHLQLTFGKVPCPSLFAVCTVFVAGNPLRSHLLAARPFVGAAAAKPEDGRLQCAPVAPHSDTT